MKKYYLFTMATAFLLGSIGVTLWLIFDIKAGGILVCVGLLLGGVASFMRPSDRWLGILDFIYPQRKRKNKTMQ